MGVDRFQIPSHLPVTPWLPSCPASCWPGHIQEDSGESGSLMPGSIALRRGPLLGEGAVCFCLGVFFNLSLTEDLQIAGKISIIIIVVSTDDH
jgi:hypothetical protein